MPEDTSQEGQKDRNYLFLSKFHSKSPLIRFVVNKFMDGITSAVKATSAKKVLDVGCGYGNITARLVENTGIRAEGVDISEEVLSKARFFYPSLKFSVGSIYELNYKKNSFDLVLATEVFEHLDEPLKALKELHRVTKKYCIITVPNEPFWRLANLLRLTYLKYWGNTPGHIQHWTRWSLKKFLENEFKVLNVKTSAFLWNIALCEKISD